jgi:hypothetical protein
MREDHSTLSDTGTDFTVVSARDRIDELLEQLGAQRSSVAVLASTDTATLDKMVSYFVSSFHSAYPDAQRDLWRVAPSASSWSVDDVRDLILSRIVVQPHRVNVVIIDRADTLSARCADRLLTVLEQPPAPTLWVLATTSPATLPVTIRGRVSTTIVRVAPVPTEGVELVPTSTPTIRAYELVAGLPADKGESRRAARAILDGFRTQLRVLVPSATTPEVWLRLNAIARALDSAEEILRTNGTPVTALTCALRAVGADDLPTPVQFEIPASPPHQEKMREVIATFEDVTTLEEPSWIPPPSNDLRWSSGPPFVPARMSQSASGSTTPQV